MHGLTYLFLILPLASIGMVNAFHGHDMHSKRSIDIIGIHEKLSSPLGVNLAVKKKHSFLSRRLQKLNTKTTGNDIDYSKDVKRTIGWVAAAMGFAGIIGATKGITPAIEFVSGYALEQSLSVDNLFVFLILFDYFKVEKVNQEKVLGYGLWGAVILRGLFIGIGSVALSKFHQIMIVFALVLYYSSYKILFADEGDEEEDLENNAVINFAKKYIKTTNKSDGDNFFTVIDGVKFATPLLLCLVCVELSDIVFAFDSVPAIFGVTQDPFIVFTSNIFAIAGLRSLFSVLSNAVTQLEYLEKAVGLILAVIAVKLTGETFNIELLTPLQSLAVVLSLLGGGIGLSLMNKSEESGEKL